MSSEIDKIISLCKRRGFIYQSGEIYGGLQGVYDFGPLGTELKNNLKKAWWNSMVYMRDDVVGIDGSILCHREVLKHSGHEDTFTDEMVDCRHCKNRMRLDHLKKGQCEKCGSDDLTPPKAFNLMFKTNFGPVLDDKSYAYLRPETAQSIFTNFKNVIDSNSLKPPFGIAQIGKAFRNEITARNYIFRVREFEQMELEYFVEPGKDEESYTYWVKTRFDWWVAQGIDPKNLKLLPQEKEDLAHYSVATTDILYRFPQGWDELEGVANRTDYDLGSHTSQQKTYHLKAKVIQNNASTAKLSINTQSGDRYIPYVIEPSSGVERGFLAILCDAFHEEKLENGSMRTYLSFKNHLAPVKAAVIPLLRNDEALVSLAKEIYDDIRHLKIGKILFENKGNIGKAYRRQDEIGTPFCITVDKESLSDKAVTIRHRDSMKQERIPLNELKQFFIHAFYDIES